MKTQPLTLQNTAVNVPTVAQAVTPMEMIQQALLNNYAPEILEKLMDLQDRWSTKQARRAFDEAIAAAKSEIPVIIKDRTVGFESKKAGAASTNYKHESLAEIARTIDPILAKHGLSYRWRSAQGEGGISVTCVLSHKDGHCEETTLKAGADNSGNKNSIQAIASTATYLSRYTLKLALGLSTGEGDDDGRAADGPATITEAQIEELQALLEASDSDEDKFKAWLKVSTLADIPAAKFQSARNALDQARIKKMSSGKSAS